MLLFRQAKACHLPHTISVSRFCQKDGGEGLAARKFPKVCKDGTYDRSSSVAYGATFPIVWHENRFFIKAKGKA